ncbi:MAG: hypothetical protein IJD59_05020 [Clostridia bacterium]|nr:hypothetical protein [Clostridia bacterium]
MPFIHVRVAENSGSVKGSFRLDGGPVKFFKYGTYIEVDPGQHIIQVDNESTVWTVRETLNKNDDLEVVLFVNGMYESICAPEYYVNRDLDAEAIESIRETIAEDKRLKDTRSKKSDTVFKWIGVVLGIIWGSAVFVMSTVVAEEFGNGMGNVMTWVCRGVAIAIWIASGCLALSCIKNKK